MEARSTRRLAVCSGAVVATIGAGLLIVPMANAEGVPGVGASALPSAAASTVGGLLGGASSSTTPSSTPSGSASDPAATTAPSTPTSTGAASSAAPSASASAPDPVASTVSGVVGPLPVVSASATAPVSVLPTTAATVAVPSGVASVGSSGSGDLTVVVGQQPDGGSLATVHLGASSGLTTADSGLLPVDRLAESAGGAAQQAASTAGTAAGAGSGAAAAATGLLSLDVTPSLGTVYPVRDGYRDSVLFRLGAVTPDGAVAALTGTAVLRRAGKEVARWRFTRSDQGLRWDGRDHGRVRAGTYSLTVSAKDALGAVFQDKTKVAVSKKRLVARTRTVMSSATSGARRMFAPARAALARGPVTVVIRTVASRVKGKQYLVFTKNGRRLALRVRNGAHSSREITVPSTFDTYTMSHTWKAGTVKLKKVRYTYTYQALK